MTEDPTSREERDQRYWRRRVNRSVRKARRFRTAVRILTVVLVNLAGLLFLAAGASRTMHHLATSPEFALRKIQVEGARRSSADRIRSSLDHLAGRNLLGLDLDLVSETAETEPWVLACSSRRVLPDTLHLLVTEREPSALVVLDGETFVVDRTGLVVAPADDALRNGLPVLLGIDRLRERARVAALRRGVEAIQRLRNGAGAWADGISAVDPSRPDRIGVVTAGSGTWILLNPDEVERNLAHYLSLRREIHDRAGFAEYVDLRWRDRIAVMPATRIPQP